MRQEALPLLHLRTLNPYVADAMTNMGLQSITGVCVCVTVTVCVCVFVC